MLKIIGQSSLLLMVAGAGFSQDLDFGTTDFLRDQNRAKELLTRKPSSFADVVFEQPVDQSEYIVGPGDQFQINIWGQINEFFPVDVLPEGNLVIPAVGDIQVSGKTLDKVKALISEEASKVYLMWNARVVNKCKKMISVKVEMQLVDKKGKPLGDSFKPIHKLLPNETREIQNEKSIPSETYYKIQAYNFKARELSASFE